MIDRACEPTLSEPDLALNLEICDIINSKQKNLPHTAAMIIVKNVNSRNPTTSMLALTLLDNCVKNCGYPFHLQISTKEFLNELVRRFPERPQSVTTVQYKILELLQQWNTTLCVSSRFKEDFKHINDMYRLLGYKGYRFPNVHESHAAVLTQSNRLRTEEELEAEDKIAQEAKLQELLRRGTPEDLEKANELMKVMAGYDPNRQPDYKKQVQDDLDKIEGKVIALNDVLNVVKPGEKVAELAELSGACKAAQVKIRDWIPESQDETRTDRLLALNDLINTVIAKYDDFKAGKAIQQSTIGSTPANKPQTTAEPSLIDLSSFMSDDFVAPAAPISQSSNSVSATKPSTNLMDDLEGLNFTGPPSIHLGSDVSLIPVHQSIPVGKNPHVVPFSSPLPSSIGNAGKPNIPTSIALGSNSVSALNANLVGSSFPPAAVSKLSPPATTVGTDNQLDILNSTVGSKQSQNIQNIPNVTSTAIKPSGQHHPAGTKKEAIVLDKNGLRVLLRIALQNSTWTGQVFFFNITPFDMSGLGLQLAVPLSMTLKPGPLSATVIPSMNAAMPVTQNIEINNPTQEPIRLRFRITYTANNITVTENAEYKMS